MTVESMPIEHREHPVVRYFMADVRILIYLFVLSLRFTNLTLEIIPWNNVCFSSKLFNGRWKWKVPFVNYNASIMHTLLPRLWPRWVIEVIRRIRVAFSWPSGVRYLLSYNSIKQDIQKRINFDIYLRELSR